MIEPSVLKRNVFMNYEEIFSYYQTQQEKAGILERPREKTREQINKHQQKIKMLEEKYQKQTKILYKKLDKLEYHWTDALVGRIAKELILRNPDKVSQYKLYGPFGLNCTLGVHFYNDDSDHVVASLTFMPDRYGGIEVWTRKINKTYPEGTIGELNYGNFVMEKVTSIEQIQKYFDESIEEHK